MTKEVKSAASIVEQAMIERLRPAEKQYVKEAVIALLNHFYMADVSSSGELNQAVYQSIAIDWCAVLHDQPAWAIAQARVEWLRQSNKKPKPADIRAICLRLTAKENAALLLARRIIKAPIEEPEDPSAYDYDPAEIIREVTGSCKTFGEA